MASLFVPGDPADAVDTFAPPGSGVDRDLMRLQPLDNASPKQFSGVWEVYGPDEFWLNFDLDFTTGSEAVDLVEARTRYFDAGGNEVAASVTPQRDLAFATLRRLDAVAGTDLAPAFGSGTGGQLDSVGVDNSCIKDLSFGVDNFLHAAGGGLTPAFPPALGNVAEGAVAARYSRNGSPDLTFDRGGFARLRMGNSDQARDDASAVVTDALSRVWLGGSVLFNDEPVEGVSTSVWAITLLDVNGAPDAPFETQIYFGAGEGGAIRALELDAGNRLIAAGYVDVNGAPAAAMGAPLAGGTFDPSFSFQVATFTPEGSASSYTDLALDASGRIYAAGWFGPPQQPVEPGSQVLGPEDRNWFVARFLADGTLDTTFGVDGVATLAFPGFPRASPTALVVDDAGRIVTVGALSSTQGADSTIAVARLLSDGSPDPTFWSPDGFTTDLGPADDVLGGVSSATDVAIDLQGRIVVALGDLAGFAAARLLPADGQPDLAFGDGGVVVVSHPDATGDGFARAVALDGDDMIILGGCADDAFALVGLRENGDLDSAVTAVPPQSRMIIAFPDEALADNGRAMPFVSEPPTNVEVELDLREVSDGDEWTIRWSDIPADFPSVAPEDTPYIFPIAPPTAFFFEPTASECEDTGLLDEPPDFSNLSFVVTQGHLLRRGLTETRHRRAVQNIDVFDPAMPASFDPGASNDQRFAYDVAVVDVEGRLTRPVDSDCEEIEEPANGDFYAWNQIIRAVADGQIVFVDASTPDNSPVGSTTPGAPGGGNQIIIRHGPDRYSRYAHLAAGTISPAIVAAGCTPTNAPAPCMVAQGDFLGRLGNSGNSGGPHLHFDILDGPAVLEHESRPFYFSSVVIDGQLQTNAALHDGTVFDAVVPPMGLELNAPAATGQAVEAEPNDSLETHQTLAAPVRLTGTISSGEAPSLAVRRDPVEDIYRIETPARAQLVARLEGDRDLDLYVLDEALQMLNPGRAGWGPGTVHDVVIPVPAGAYTLAVSDPTGEGETDYVLEVDLRPFRWEYAAKIVCGMSQDSQDERLVAGQYGTVVNIHNPGAMEALVFKKLALAFPPETQEPGEILEIGEDLLGYDEAVKTDCNEIRLEVLTDPAFAELDYFEGFVVLQSTERLDVTGVYTSRALGPDGSPGAHSAIDVEEVSERGLGVDLSVEKASARFRFDIADRIFHLFLYRIDVENRGPATATSVRVTDTQTLELEDASGGSLLLAEPLILPPTGELIDIIALSETETQATFDLGSIAAGTSRSAFFWGIAFASAEGDDARARLINRAELRATEGELLEDDNIAEAANVIFD